MGRRAGISVGWKRSRDDPCGSAERSHKKVHKNTDLILIIVDKQIDGGYNLKSVVLNTL